MARSPRRPPGASSVAQPSSLPAPLDVQRARRPRGPEGRPLLAAVGALVLVVLLGLGAWALLADHGTSPGPLRTAAADSISGPQVAGRPFGYGVAVVYNTGSSDAVLDRVELEKPTPGLRVLAVYASGSERKFLSASISTRWPDPSSYTDLHPVAGARVAPAARPAGKRGVELVFKLQADKPGRYSSKGVAVDYRVDGAKHHAVLRAGLLVCVHAPGKPKDRNCPPAPV